MESNRRRRKEFAPKLIVDLTESGIKLRVLFMILAVGIASFAFYSVFTKVLHTESGWQTVPAQNSKTSAGQEFVLNYEFGVSGMSAAEEWVRLNKLYPQLLDRSCRVFDTAKEEGVANLYELNSRPGEEVEIEAELYDALEMLENSGSRYIYYAPVYQLYRGLFRCGNDWEAQAFDPCENGEIRAYAARAASYAADAESIKLELLGDRRVRLDLSAEYKAFAEENEISNYLDLFYWKNAFVLDCTAQGLAAEGFSSGIISSREGFTRAMGEGTYSVKLIDRRGGSLFPAAILNYEGPQSVVTLYEYPVSGTEDFFYSCSDGSLRGPFIKSENGLCDDSSRGMTVYSKEKSCAELLLAVWDGFVSGDFNHGELRSLGIYTAYAENLTVINNGPAFVTDLYSGASGVYHAS